MVRPGGLVLIAVPADPRLWSAHDDDVGHVRRYTRPELTALFDDDRFTIESVRSWNVLLRPIVAVRRRQSTGNDLTRQPKVVNAALDLIIKAERHLPVGGLPGVSLLLNARVR